MNDDTEKEKENAQEYKNLALDPDVHRRLKILAANLSVHMKDLIAGWVEEKSADQLRELGEAAREAGKAIDKHAK